MNALSRALLILPLLLAPACAEEEGDPLCDREVPLTYESWGMSFMDTHCNGCHSSITSPAQRRGAPPGVDLDTYGGVLQWVERIDDRVILAAEEERSQMPPGGGPTAEELDMLHEWLQCQVYPDRERWEGME